MGDTVVHLVQPLGPSEAVVRFLERQLESARAGEFVAVAFAYMGPGGVTGSGATPCDPIAPMVGAIEALKTKLVRDMLA